MVGGGAGWDLPEVRPCVQAAVVLGLEAGRIRAIYLVANPEKLERLDP